MRIAASAAPITRTSVIERLNVPKLPVEKVTESWSPANENATRAKMMSNPASANPPSTEVTETIASRRRWPRTRGMRSPRSFNDGSRFPSSWRRRKRLITARA